MHRECYFSYHQLRYGVYLDNRYEVNKSRAKQGMKSLMSRQEVNFPWNAVQPDIHAADEEVQSNGSQEQRGRGSREGTEEELESNNEEEDAKSEEGSAV